MYQKRAEGQALLNDILGFLKEKYALLNTLRIFVSNYLELLWQAYVLKQYEMDKYYHSKANCEAVQKMGE